MTDVNIKIRPEGVARAAQFGASASLAPAAMIGTSDETRKAIDRSMNNEQPPSHYDLIELLFYAYRDFTSDPDARLDAYGFGRAHHRVLHFVDRNPGLMVTDLLGILRITKQSLGRVLKQLVDKGFIEQKPGPLDRRQRLLFATQTGKSLAQALSSPQSERLTGALAALPPGSEAVVRQFLYAMINEDARDDVARMIYKANHYARPGPIGAADKGGRAAETDPNSD